MMPDQAPSEDELFEQALELPTPEERQVFLEEACGENSALLESLQKLLDCHLQAEQLLFFPEDSPRADDAKSFPEEIEISGRMIGCYRLIEKIGEGGFGVVYLAEQERPIVRRVALKVIKLGMDTREVIARFNAERQALAIMDHPNIAKVLDTGATDSGRPYFVMDYVPGAAITTYCDDHKLALQERLDLFLTVCEAIQHAHQKGIIHRDIKPSNVLIVEVSGRATAKVIDFGIAKALEQKLTNMTLVTQQGQVIGTPAYMSPEQATSGGSDIDTRSDIYSLGVLLYEMLTGVTPLDTAMLPQSGFDLLRRTLHEEETVKPSARIRTMPIQERTTLAHKRRTDSAEFPRLLKGDLDWIVLKALAKDRNQRYRTVADFERDIECYTLNEPVSAVAPSKRYLLEKYVRRHRAGISILALIGLILAFSSTFSFWKARQALEARQEAVELRGRAEVSAIEATEERNKARLQASKSDRLVADQLLKQNQVAKALVYLARSLKNDPGNQSTYKRLMSTMTQRHIALAHAHPTNFDTRGLAGHFSDDGSKLAIIHEDLTISFVDTKSQQQVHSKDKLQSLDYGVQVRFTKDGTRAVTLENESGTFCIWDLKNGQRVVPPFLNGSSCMHFKLTPDDRLIISSGADSRIRFFDLDTGENLYNPIPLAMPIKVFGLTTDGTKLLVPQGYRKALEIWNIPADAPPVPSPLQISFSTESQNLFYLDAISPNNSTLLAYRTPPNDAFFGRTGRRALSAWDISTGEMLWENEDLREEPVTIVWSADGTRMMASFLSGKHEILDGTNGNLIAPISASGLSTFWEGADHQTWIGQDDAAGLIHIWERETGNPFIPVLETGPSRPLIHLDPANRRIFSFQPNQSNGLGSFDFSGSQAQPYDFAPLTSERFVDITPDWETSVWIDQHDHLMVRNHHTGTLVTAPTKNGIGITEARIARNGKHLATLSIDRKTMTCYSLPEVKEVSQFRWSGPDYIGKWALSDDGASLVFATDAPGDKDDIGAKQIQLWHPLENSEPILLDAFEGDYIDLAISPDGTRVFLGMLQAPSVIYQKKIDWVKLAIPDQRELINGDFSPDGRWLAVVSPETGAHVYDLVENQWTTRHLDNSGFGQISRVQFSPNSQRIFVTGLRKKLSAVGDRAKRPDRYPPETALIWDWSHGELASDQLTMNGMIPIGLSVDETRVLLYEDSGPKLIDLSPAYESPPDWLYPFVETYCGFRFNEEGKIEAISADSFSSIHQLAAQESDNDLLKWCHWLTSNRLERPISPRADQSLPEHVNQLLLSSREVDLSQARILAPFDSRVMGKLASLLFSQDDPIVQRQAHWLMTESLRKNPGNSAALFAQAISLEKKDDDEAAWDALEKALAENQDDWSYRKLQAKLLTKREQPQQALAALEKAITLLKNQLSPAERVDLDRLKFEKIGLLRRLERWDELRIFQQELFQIPPRDPGLSAKLIDLTDFYNAALDQNWQLDSVGNLALLSPGLNVLNEVPFDIRGIIQLQCDLMLKNPSTQSLANQYPPQVTNIPIHQSAETLHFLQASLYGSSVFAPKGTLVVTYLINYADGEQRSVEIKLGEQTRDWWIGKAANSPAFAPEAGLELAWKGYINSGNIGLYKTTWPNPRPSVAIKSIDLISAMATPGSFLVAITLE